MPAASGRQRIGGQTGSNGGRPRGAAHGFGMAQPFSADAAFSLLARARLQRRADVHAALTGHVSPEDALKKAPAEIERALATF
jgi:hypothetical protein